MFERIYVEIGNVCNLACSFCQGTKKPKRQMSAQEFETVCEKIKDKTKYIYLHVMGEPLLHPSLESFIKIANEAGLKVCITTNGTLLPQKGDILLENFGAVHKVSVSLHSPEANENVMLSRYLESVCDFSKKASELGIYTVLRLWNEDSDRKKGLNSQNAFIESFLKEEFSEPWQERRKGFRLKKKVFLEYDSVFTWPSSSDAEKITRGFCHGLENQLAILADGTVVPCCLDSNGELELGNIFLQSLDEILMSERAQKIKKGFESGSFTEELCQKCTFARKFKIRNN